MAKITEDRGRPKATESTTRSRVQDTGNVTPVPSPSVDQQRGVVHTVSQETGLSSETDGKDMFVSVVDKNQNPLMPTSPSRARKWISSGKATPFWKRGVFCVRLNVEPSDRKVQDIVVGVDPGSKREAFTVKSKAHTYLNVLTNTVYWVKEKIELRQMGRNSRRWRNTPYRQCRKNRNRTKDRLPPSTRARWDWKLRIVKWLKKMFPIQVFIVEDVKAKPKGLKRWDMNFSPLLKGKAWFYSELRKIGSLELRSGWYTKILRDKLGLKKMSSKLADKFECHNVDSWTLAHSIVGGSERVDNSNIIKLIPLQFSRRQLHLHDFAKGGIRKKYGGTRCVGFSKGSYMSHPVYGVCYVSGEYLKKLVVRSIQTGEMISKKASVSKFKFLTYSSWRKEDNTVKVA